MDDGWPPVEPADDPLVVPPGLPWACVVPPGVVLLSGVADEPGDVLEPGVAEPGDVLSGDDGIPVVPGDDGGAVVPGEDGGVVVPGEDGGVVG